MKKREAEEQFFYIADVLVVLLMQYFTLFISKANRLDLNDLPSLEILSRARAIASYLLADTGTLDNMLDQDNIPENIKIVKNQLSLLEQETSAGTLFQIKGHENDGPQIQELVVQTLYQHEDVRKHMFGRRYYKTRSHAIASTIIDIYGSDIEKLSPEDYAEFVESYVMPTADNFLTPVMKSKI
jgi:hypothetical protein